ncbi:MAG: ABC transporter substrate-binding protein, partial [Candidatus Dormibacteraeota bacterium]|nr:ABC transporter substrate-binding protein [Candidatus Dormibacteraeota bacterium]
MADGLFAQHGLDVAIDDPPGGPENILYVADGRRDACLTSVHHLLTATQRNGPLAARFVAIIVRRSPISALVPLDSPLTTPADLAGRPFASSPDGAHTKEFLAILRHLGIEAPALTGHDDAWGALGRGDVDFIVDFVDTVPRVSRMVGTRLRAIPVGLDTYASGLLVGDAMPEATVTPLVETLVASLEAQRTEAGRGLPDLMRRYPDTVAAEALEGWQLVEPYIFTGDPPGSMRR